MIFYYIYTKAQTNASLPSATAFNVRPSYVYYFTACREFSLHRLHNVVYLGV